MEALNTLERPKRLGLGVAYAAFGGDHVLLPSNQSRSCGYKLHYR
jgi:hypothetical protein